MERDQGEAAYVNRPGFLLSRVGTAVQAGFKDVLGGWGIRPLHFVLLNTLERSPASSQQELCQALRIDSGNIVAMIDQLESLGFARRTRDETDRRRQLVSITATGQDALEKIRAAVEKYDDQFFRPLDDSQRGTLARLLALIYASTPEGQGAGFVAT